MKDEMHRIAAIKKMNDKRAAREYKRERETKGMTEPSTTEAGQEKPAFNQIAYQNEFNRKKYDRINLTMPKGKKERVRVAAAAAGQSVNEYINAAIEKALNEDETAAGQKGGAL